VSGTFGPHPSIGAGRVTTFTNTNRPDPSPNIWRPSYHGNDAPSWAIAGSLDPTSSRKVLPTVGAPDDFAFGLRRTCRPSPASLRSMVGASPVRP